LHPQQTPPPQLYTLSLHDALPICPSALSSGKPPLHLSCRALSEDARASSEASSARSASARSRPGPLKKGSGGKSVMMSERKRDGLAVERRETSIVEAVERLPPTLALG